MRALLPFDTETERKPVKIYEWSFSWRQTAYLGAGLLLTLQLCQWVYVDSFGFLVNLLFWAMCLPISVPFLLFALIRHPQTGYFMDRHFWYRIRHRKTQSGVWRG